MASPSALYCCCRPTVGAGQARTGASLHHEDGIVENGASLRHGKGSPDLKPREFPARVHLDQYNAFKAQLPSIPKSPSSSSIH